MRNIVINRFDHLIVLILLCMSQISCKKFVQIDPAPDLVESRNIFSNEKTALSAVSGVYTRLFANQGLTNGGLSLYCGLLSDEIYPTTSNSSDDPFYQNQLDSKIFEVNSQLYFPGYRVIYLTNAVIEGLAKSQLPDPVKNQLTGEMKVLRSICFFYLSNLFGDFPLTLTTDYRINATMTRTNMNQITDQLIVDLLDAKQLLSNTYPSTGKVRVNKMTATALLARIYLYKKDWINAEIQSSEIINSGQYSLAPTAALSNIFQKNSPETIFQIASPGDNQAVGEATAFVPWSPTVMPMYALTPQLLKAFEPNDQRKNNWLNKNTVSGVEYWYPNKYKQSFVASGAGSSEYQIVFRLAEQYLIRAEARTQQLNIDGALTDLNNIHMRAGLSGYNISDQTSLLVAIAKETQIEFFSEWGHRWLDLKRTSKADEILKVLKGNYWQSTDVLLPFPEDELLNNPFLEQNSGY